MVGICKFCGKGIYLNVNGWRHENPGREPICNHIPEPKDDKTLADFAGSDKLFKRPMHANPHGFTPGSDHLKEIRFSTWGGQINICSDFPRLTREDLTATDWEEVTLPKEVEEYRKFGPNNTTNTGADGLLPALS